MKFLTLVRFIYGQYKRQVWLGIGVLVVGLMVWRLMRTTANNVMQWQFVDAYGIKFPMRYSLHGLDVSRHNNRIDWDRVAGMNADGVRMQFAFMKATEGATLGDPTFAKNWREAKRVGLRRGAYHFYHPTRDPIKQAANFIKRVSLQTGDLAPVLDFEVTNGVPEDKIISDLHLFLDAIEAEYNIRPIIYTNPSLYKRFVKGNFDVYPLWIADYSKSDLNRYNADKLYIWQHNKSGWVRGIRGFVDINTFVMAPEQLNELTLN
ncbi:glycoside hydrolase family 25 protein [Fibrella aquatilis]|uniref:Glycoside hydrolase n=1 Tax=Fibrella aquatilis TaxID=2817059 RepID=A0A939JZS3_9BACT|nr:GH25 family lysozyme [Fibrella aquatilis]MBO0931718.1 glycoside hydrolase [Fibrella aquatilis]